MLLSTLSFFGQLFICTVGYLVCPCMDREHNQNVRSVYQHTNMDGTDRQTPYPANWGTKCEAWDEAACTPQTQMYCNQPYCLVDRDSCQLQYHEWGKPKVQSGNVSSLYFSYQACGSQDLFLLHKVLAGQTFRVSFIANNGPYVLDWNKTEPLQSGLGPVAFQQMSKFANFNITLVDIQTTGAAGSGKEYDDCIRMIREGLTDVCCCNFWDTIPRYEAIHIPFYISPSGFLVKARPGYNIYQLVSPFHVTLWGAIIGTLCAAASLLLFFEHAANDTEFRLSQHHERVHAWNGFHAFYLVTTGFLSTGSIVKPATAAGKTLIVGMSVCFLLIVSSYCANMASILTVNRLDTQITSIEDVMENAGTICTWGDMELQRYWHTAKTHKVSGYPELLERLNNGSCLAAMDDMLFWEYALQYDNAPRGISAKAWEPCTIRAAADVMHTAQIGAFMTHSEAGAALRTVAKTLLSNGLKEQSAWNNVKSFFDLSEKVACWEGSSGLSVYDVGGAFVVLLVTSVASIVVHVIERVHYKPKRGETKTTPLTTTSPPVTQSDNLQRRMVPQGVNADCL